MVSIIDVDTEKQSTKEEDGDVYGGEGAWGKYDLMSA